MKRDIPNLKPLFEKISSDHDVSSFVLHQYFPLMTS